MATRPVRTAAVIGAGPAGLMAAEILAGGGVAVTVYDRMPSVGRKFLMAGRGGLNLTHSEPLPAFLSRYRPRDTPLGAAVARFAPEDLRGWCDGLGQATFVGSSGRVFPRAMKASPLLRAWLGRLAAAQVRILPRHRWTGWAADGALRFATWDGEVLDRPVATVLAMGGASWPQLGSDGEWAALLDEAGLPVAPFEPSNCGFTVPWSSVFLDRFEGQPLKNVAVAFEGFAARGDLVVTRTGLEGGAIYAVSAVLREAIRARGAVEIAVALRPDQPVDALARKLADRSGKPSLATTLRKRLNLPPIAIALLHEAVLSRSRPLNSLEVAEMAALINAVPLRLTGVSPITRAISTAGGLRFAALDGGFMLRDRPGVFAAGEMLDWEAPTGGYLLQGCFASGAAAGQGALAFIDASASAGIPEPERRLGR